MAALCGATQEVFIISQTLHQTQIRQCCQYWSSGYNDMWTCRYISKFWGQNGDSMILRNAGIYLQVHNGITTQT
jgi:hypothetical protein